MAAPRLNFSKLNGFPDEIDEKIETVKFIQASNEVIGIIEQFGKLFSPVVSDMRGNVEALHAHYHKDKESRKYIEDMILSDAQRETHLWLLWLKRALELIERFFWHVLNDDDVIRGKSDDLRPMISQAYNEVLKPFHGFLLQNTFKLLNRWMPSRSTLLGSDVHFDENVKHLWILMPRMKKHIDKIEILYVENNLTDLRKV